MPRKNTLCDNERVLRRFDENEEEDGTEKRLEKTPSELDNTALIG